MINDQALTAASTDKHTMHHKQKHTIIFCEFTINQSMLVCAQIL
jgi:hypothetical protein